MMATGGKQGARNVQCQQQRESISSNSLHHEHALASVDPTHTCDFMLSCHQFMHDEPRLLHLQTSILTVVACVHVCVVHHAPADMLTPEDAPCMHTAAHSAVVVLGFFKSVFWFLTFLLQHTERKCCGVR